MSATFIFSLATKSASSGSLGLIPSAFHCRILSLPLLPVLFGSWRSVGFGRLGSVEVCLSFPRQTVHFHLLAASTGSMASWVSPVQLLWCSTPHSEHVARLTPVLLLHFPHFPFGSLLASGLGAVSGCGAGCVPGHHPHSHSPVLLARSASHLLSPEHVA